MIFYANNHQDRKLNQICENCSFSRVSCYECARIKHSMNCVSRDKRLAFFLHVGLCHGRLSTYCYRKEITMLKRNNMKARIKIEKYRRVI